MLLRSHKRTYAFGKVQWRQEAGQRNVVTLSRGVHHLTTCEKPHHLACEVMVIAFFVVTNLEFVACQEDCRAKQGFY